MNTAMRQANLAGVRDLAVRKLRDWTIAVAVAAAAGVALIAWVSAATIPGSTSSASGTGSSSTGVDGQPVSAGDDGFAQAPPPTTQPGSGFVVSGGSH